MSDHESFMRQALELAARGRGWVSPNPMVGALIVRDGKVIGRGWHAQFGGPHAEVCALQSLGPSDGGPQACGTLAAGATLYCTLEPCAHVGKTGPCVDAILRAGLKRVVLGARDTHPLAAGGVEKLRAAGVTVILGVLEQECRKLNAAFFKFVESGRPLISLKWAMSLDGKIATANGDSKWITSPEARACAHRLRAEHDAVLVGIGTLLADHARLNCRLAQTGTAEARKQPRRVILDSNARTPLDAPLWSAAGGPITIFCSTHAPEERIVSLRGQGAEVVALDGPAGRPPLKAVLQALGKMGTLSVLVEGGSTVLGAFLDEGLADRTFVFVAPRLVGGRESVPAMGGCGAARIAQALGLRPFQVERVGPDILLMAECAAADAGGPEAALIKE